MRRIDKIMFSALDEPKSCKGELKPADNKEQTGNVLDSEKKCCAGIESTVLPVSGGACNDEESYNLFKNDVEFPEAPIFSPLTPLRSNYNKNDVLVVSEIDSPAAPIYSPLTPLRASENKPDSLKENREENSSPLMCMSPKTFELFQTLSEAQTPMQQDADNFDEILEIIDNVDYAKPSCSKKNQDCVSDFSTDTDVDFIPNSESESSDSEKIVPLKLKVLRPQVHKDAARTQSRLETRPIDTNTKRISQESPVETRNETTESNPNETDERNSNDDSNVDHGETSCGRPKKGRKRTHPNFTIAQAKERKYANKSYLTKKKNLVEPKVFKDYTCSCQKQCYSLVSQEKRRHEFQKFVTLGSYKSQILYIANTVKETPKLRTNTVLRGNKTGTTKPREFRRIYSICGINVCRDMYINTFQITTKKIDVSLKKIRRGVNLEDQRGKKTAGQNRCNVDSVEFVKNVIKKLPQYESHYRRDQSNGCKFLKLGMTLPKIYDLYLEELNKMNTESTEHTEPVSFSTLKRIFYKNFNLRCRTLKKDTCNKCDTLNIKIKNCESELECIKYEEEKEEHLKKAENLRKAMNNDMMRAKTEEDFECLTFDMEKTLPLPRIPTSIVFYKRQLWFYNCSIHTGSDNIGHCYVWVEGEAGRGSQEVGSCITKFIKNKLDPKVQHLVLWSDCCGGQNRNIKIILMLKVVLDSHPTLKTITFKYLESGHTFLPNDTDFSKIEQMLKYHERVYTADDYIRIIKKSKRKNPLQVYRMTKDDFMGTKKLEKKTTNRKLFVTKEKVNWLKTKEILINKENKYDLFMKNATDGEDFKQLNIEKKCKGTSISINEQDLITLLPNGKDIPQAKLNDLMSMMDLIPKEYHDFYKQLKGNANIVDDSFGNGGLDFVTEDCEETEA